MKHALLIVSAMLILFTTACAAAMLVPATLVVLESASNDESHDTKVAENISTSSPEQNGKNAPAHISGSMKPEIHISGKTKERKYLHNLHISGKTFNHVSGGSYY